MRLEAHGFGVITYSAYNTVVYKDRVEFKYKPPRKSILTIKVIPMESVISISGSPKLSEKKSKASGDAIIIAKSNDITHAFMEGNYSYNEDLNLFSVEDENGQVMFCPASSAQLWKLDESSRSSSKRGKKKGDKDKEKKSKGRKKKNT